MVQWIPKMTVKLYSSCQAKAHPDLLQVIQPVDMLVGSQIDADAAAV